MRPHGHNASCVRWLQRCIILMYSTGDEPCRGTRSQFRLWHSGFVTSQAGLLLKGRCPRRSIQARPSAAAFANRAMVHLKAGEHAKAEQDCSSALVLDPRFLKAWQRRATARRQLGKPLDAAQDIEEALRCSTFLPPPIWSFVGRPLRSCCSFSLLPCFATAAHCIHMWTGARILHIHGEKRLPYMYRHPPPGLILSFRIRHDFSSHVGVISLCY